MNKKLLSILKSNYGNGADYKFFLEEFMIAYKFCINNENIDFFPIEIFDKKSYAHVAIVKDKRLSMGSAFFGFFEATDPKIAEILWKKLLKQASEVGITKLLGPVNGSIWHQYRCMSKSDGSDYFKTELPTKPFYYEFLVSKLPSKIIRYYSAERDDFASVLKKIQPNPKKLKENGFSIEVLKNINIQSLISIATLTGEIFSKSWGYTKLTPSEFLELYPMEKFREHVGKVYILKKDNSIIGYCGTGIESKDTLLLKTICILPEYQGLGLGNALAYRVHMDALKEGYKKIIYALIRANNNVKKFPNDGATIFRNYASFEYKI